MTWNSVVTTIAVALAAHQLMFVSSIKTDVMSHFRSPFSNGSSKFIIRPETLMEMCPRRADMSDDVPLYPCPSPNGRYTEESMQCIRYEDLCNGIIDCDGGEDENYALCVYHELLDFQETKGWKEVSRGQKQLQKEIDFWAINTLLPFYEDYYGEKITK